MENKGGKSLVWVILVVVIGLIALTHTFLHFSIYLSSTGKISGFAFLEQNSMVKTPKFQPISLVVIVFEWILLFAVIIRGRSSKQTLSAGDLSRIVSERKSHESVSKTDMDVLYDLLKDKKELSISQIAKAFKIDKSVAMEWSNMLEESNLATIEYSKMGEPSVRIR
jgi:Mg2+/Co2+ transporter CorB